MTTVVTTRRPLWIINTSNQAEQRTSKRAADGLHDEPTMQGMLGAGGPTTAIADYERDDDFRFVRKSKMVKTQRREGPAPEPPKTSGRGRAAKEHVAQDLAPVDQGTKETTATVATTEPVITKATRKSSRQKPSVDASMEKPPLKPGEETTPQTNSTSIKRGRNAGEAPKRPVPNWDESPPPRVVPSKIALPMSDTPVINRNKEMRMRNGGSRRSSLGMRGRRASSLIDGGQSAIPHREVNPADFFKHIEASLLEPRRMKQLLTWCGERSLSEKPPHGTPNAHAILGARAIQDHLLKNFAARSEFSDWFSRDDSVPKAPVIPKPNPRNIELDEKLAQLEINIKRLRDEKKAWQAIRKPPPRPPLEQPPLFDESETGRIELPDFDLLDPEEGQIRGYLADETTSFEATRSQTESRLRNIQSSLEFQVDQLANNIHTLEQRVLVAGKEAGKVLSISALQLRQREKCEKAKAGTQEMPVMEVLRSLGSIHPEGRGRRENQKLKAKEATKSESNGYALRN
ncbi:Mis12-Mtw1 protein family-domain-containing protein [Ilyonectria robusta]|uniref:Mis12-Mtw1 protein family-domain-containing protein n=1 Tax=Ilyonectria robusta TaxID=1079257 RepID=UPI001E8D0988|nr:Mis12-Mtw1 protein family-domain-containing protein [Ilyonectria robusta]KAH8659669.1 Mis12-Mtw1 protein family-domain-containing protein [Ilyonectria robusta]